MDVPVVFAQARGRHHARQGVPLARWCRCHGGAAGAALPLVRPDLPWRFVTG
jgi:hypothetical protein